jgi:hypothetical protein
MIEFKNKNIFFSGHGEKIDKDELIKYCIQNKATIIDSVDDADIIIQGYMTPNYLEDKFYLLSKEGITLISIEEFEKEFSLHLDIDSMLMALKISKDNNRVIQLLKNKYFSDDIFIKILKYYNWNNIGIYDDDDNRDVATAITSRFCTLVESNHNIQYSPIGIYYTALETTNPNLLEIIFNMPKYSISDKNAHHDQPLTLKEVVALNPNTPKPVLIQIFKKNNINELKFLALNSSLNTLLKQKLFNLDDETILRNLILGDNIDIENIDIIMNEKNLKNLFLKSTSLLDESFQKFTTTSLTEIEYIHLSANPSLTTIQIKRLFEQQIDNVNINLLKNTKCPATKIEEFLLLNDKIYNITIAHNENLSEKIYQKLYDIHDSDIDLSLCFNHSTPPSILTKLHSKNDSFFNEAISQNRNTPISILMQLQIDTRYHTHVSNNETYKEFSRNSLGIIQDNNNKFKRNTYMDTI